MAGQSLLEEIVGGDALSLAQAARLVPATRGESGSASPSCVWRWVTKGATTRAGVTVKLEAALIGSRWITSRAALMRFLEALNPVSAPVPVLPPSRTEAQRRKAAAAASKKLEAMGA